MPPTRIELGPAAPEAAVISISPRGRAVGRWSLHDRALSVDNRRNDGDSLQHPRDDLDHLVVDVAGRGQRLLLERIERSAPEVADPAAGLLDDERAGSGVPGLQLPFPETIDAPDRKSVA